jgi:hypothetical protein
VPGADACGGPDADRGAGERFGLLRDRELAELAGREAEIVAEGEGPARMHS